MTRFSSIALSITLLLSVAVNATQSYADDDKAPIKITLYPNAEPKPALKYKLLPSRMDQIPGNAAVYYGKVKAEEGYFFTNKELWDNIQRWQETPLEELVKEKARVPSGGSIDFHLDRAARCRFCDWQMPIGDVQFYSTLLPELQESRQFFRIIAANARIDIAHKRFAKAIRRFQTNNALGRHVADGDFIVGGLVGVAICRNMLPQITEFVQQPDAPNLYWALTALPSPLVDLRKAVELESHGLEYSYPELANYAGIGLRSYASREQTHPELWSVTPSDRTPEGWKRLYYAIARDLQTLFADDNRKQAKSMKELEDECKQVYPKAKKSLIVRAMQSDSLLDRGKQSLDIEAMPMHQVILLYMHQVYRDKMDDMAKHFFLPYPAAIKGFDTIAKRYQEEKENIPEALRFEAPDFIGIKVAKTAQTRLEREIAVLRILEALRIHGASHDGELPTQLADITEVPIPIDPVTGKPFEYRLEDGTARLQGPALRGVRVDYEIVMDSQ